MSRPWLAKPGTHRGAVLQALFVTFLWSTSWVLIKTGLHTVPALTFAGLRYLLASLVLLPFALRPTQRARLQILKRKDWAGLVALGLLFYTITQGAQYVGLSYLPAVTVSLLLNFTSLAVAFMGILFLSERPSPLQWIGMVVYLVGIALYLQPASIPPGQVFGFLIVLVGVLANALSAVFGRSINRRLEIPPLLVTIISMGSGAILLLAAGLALEDLPRFDLAAVLIIAWLALANTALAFTLWNHTLRTLSAMESSILNNTMTLQIALLAWLFLDEALTPLKIAGMLVAGMGAVLVQLRRTRHSSRFKPPDRLPDPAPAQLAPREQRLGAEQPGDYLQHDKPGQRQEP